MDPRSSSEDLTLSDETALAIACSAPLPEGDDDLFLSDSSALPLALTDGGAILAESTQEIIRYEASDSSTVATHSVIVERTIVNRSMTSNPRRAINPLELHIPRTLSLSKLEQGHTTQLLTNVQVQHDTVDIVPTQTFLGIQPTVRSNDPVNAYDPVLLTHDQSMNAQRFLPSSAPSQMTDPSSNHELVPSDVEMENETSETALTLVTNFSVQLQSLQTQVDSSSVMFNSLNDRLNLTLQTSQSQHEMTATSMNSLSISLHELSDRTHQVQLEMNSTYGELKSALTDLQHLNRSPTHETDFVRLETVLAGQQTTISNLHQSLQQHSAEQQRISQNLETLAHDRASDFHRILHELQRTPPSRTIESNRRLNEQVDALTQDNSTRLQRVLTLEVASQRLSHEIHAVAKSESDSPVSTNGFDSPKSAPDSTHRLLLELQSSFNAMASEMSEVKESIADSTSNQAFGRAVKYTTTPTSDDQAHCEFFMKQLIDQADRCQLDDPDRKMLLGLKLSSDKVHPALNHWWIALSKTKNGDVWSEIYDNFMDRFCNRTPRELVDNLFEDSERLEGEFVKAYAIRLQSILDDIDVPDHQGVVIFKRGVRHARAESCLENTDKELCSIADCMKLLRTRQIRLDDPPVYRERMRPRSGSATTTLTSSRSNLSDRSAPSTPEQSPRPNRRNSKVGFQEDPTLAKILEAIHTTQTSQQAFVAQIQQLTEALTKPATPFFAAPVQAQMNVSYAYPSPYAPGFLQQPTPPSASPVAVPTTTQPPGPSRSRPRTDFAPVMITSKPDDMTTSGVKVCGRCDRLGHGAEDCPRKFLRCNLCHQVGHYVGEHVRTCPICKQLGHSASRCPSRPADKA
ncbi:hypothetical protein Ae201684P_019431 [Aphanomyces euteiches]|uniref:CCHC-type domain-containing protein n=1 Tax=Aphanomyces euteiches TaxID=100861 RepID=A0A6G0W5V5_9STRA|nr:hypothetical protein Ae201684_018460 [Aphanomyces euteiches]KAH9078340.1 hypothetical protein Ae201684P_019431 [Aphanomyces euteiches]